MSNKHIFKVCFVGDGGVGKTSFSNKFVNSTFNQDYKMTIGVAFLIKKFTMPNGQIIHFQLWDTGGQQRFRTIRTMYYKGASGFVLVYDVTNRTSFENLPQYYDEIRKLQISGRIIVVGNKIDLIDKRIISQAEGRKFANSIGALYSESSAKTGEGIDNTMIILGRDLINDPDGLSNISHRSDITKMQKTVHPLLLSDDEILLYELK